MADGGSGNVAGNFRFNIPFGILNEEEIVRERTCKQKILEKEFTSLSILH
jgi:hypothetical protein